MTVPKNPADRFMAKVQKTDTCWLWMGARISTGYGCVRISGCTVLAHRLVWELANGPIPDGLYVCHHCDNPPCVRLSHLFLGTNSENQLDASAKGRKHNQNTNKTHCISGHPLSGDNLHITPDGWRRCRACGREWVRRKRKMGVA